MALPGKTCWALLLACSSFAGAQAAIKDDERLFFFPSYGHLPPDGSEWRAEIHGWAYEPEADSSARKALLDQLRRALGVAPGSAEAPLFDERAQPFLVDNERGKGVAVRIGGRRQAVGRTAADGHVRAEVAVSTSAAGPGWLAFHDEASDGAPARFSGEVLLLGATGTTVISDIDDTIKVSAIRDRKALLANTFLKPFVAVEGMSELYRDAWGAASFHYVSASPWQLYPALERFLRESGFPRGTFNLKGFRWKERSFFGLFDGQRAYKRGAIEPMLRRFPGRRFVLVGDSGEQDPEIFGALARDFPVQVAAIYIRDTTGEPASSLRYRSAFAGVPPERWRVFSVPGELPRVLP